MAEASGFQVGAQAPRYYEQHVAVFMAPFVEALISAVVRPGDAVLDVACGTGFATRAAARATGPSGLVVGADLNPAMIGMARTVSAGNESEIAWHEASALDLPFGDDEFDVVVSQQGIQFFPDVGEGLREMSRVVRPGGRLAVSVWAPMEGSPFVAAETEMLVARCGSDPVVSRQAFPEGGAQQLRSWFGTAGLTGVDVQLVEATVSLPPVDEYVPAHLRAIPWSAGFFELSDRSRREALDEVADSLREYRTSVGLDVPFRSFLAAVTI